MRICRAIASTSFFAVIVLAAVAVSADDGAKVDFRRDIRPILSDKCYTCHGPDANSRQAGLRLDTKDGVFAETESGYHAIVPGDVEESELVYRIFSDDEYEQMPPPDQERQLTAAEKELLKRWISQGAVWEDHWSFIAPARPNPPKTPFDERIENPIDSFVFAQLGGERLAPSPEADTRTLIRRVTYDLTGLPPTLDEIGAFLADESPDAYEKLVDRLMASPCYGEHKARYWLDAVRYGDTHGLHLDNYREMWPYREWVIQALSSNMPFDDFTRKQLAGDLLKNPTTDDLVASGYIRAHVTTNEGGSIAKEVEVRNAVDRTETTGAVWMGLTIGCAVCHDHKFDPVSQKEFYELYAFFNSTAEPAMDKNAPYIDGVDITVPSLEQRDRLAALNKREMELAAGLDRVVAELQYSDPGPTVEETPAPAIEEIVWIDDGLPPGANAKGDTPWQFVSAPDHPVLAGEKSHRRTAKGRSQHYFDAAAPPLEASKDGRLFTYVYLDPDDPPREIMLQWNSGNWLHRAYWGENLINFGRDDSPERRPMGELPELGKWVRLEIDPAAVGIKPGMKIQGWAFTQFDGTVYWDKAGMTSRSGPTFQSQRAWETFVGTETDASGTPQEIRGIVDKPLTDRSEAELARLRQYFLMNVYPLGREAVARVRQEMARVEQERSALKAQFPHTLIAKELPEPRPAHVLQRGEYDKPGEPVSRKTPSALPPLPEGAPANRLGLAEWLVAPEHPLTARVTVNRYWRQYFGKGLVRTSEDFGSQGEWPSHPELLDWLAVEFIESGWDVNHIHRLIVTSATYRQSSKVSPDLLKRDPENRLLARGPRFRLDAETVRDNALAVSGLLVERLGGPSVKPYQPDGIWEAVGYSGSNTVKFKRDSGDALYRRSLYTFWKRTAPPPTMLLFDAPTRETCTVRRERTNTPLAALALMNDVQFVEAARAFAERIMKEGGANAEDRAAWAFEVATARKASDREAAILLDQFQSHRRRFAEDPEAAKRLLSAGESPRDESLSPADHAAWTMVANVILNLDEVITKP